MDSGWPNSARSVRLGVIEVTALFRPLTAILPNHSVAPPDTPGSADGWPDQRFVGFRGRLSHCASFNAMSGRVSASSFLFREQVIHEAGAAVRELRRRRQWLRRAAQALGAARLDYRRGAGCHKGIPYGCVQSRSSSLMDVFDRVRSSTRLMITAQ